MPTINNPERSLPAVMSASQYEGLCLVKVYHSVDHQMLFSSWVSKNTTGIIQSVVFRYWRVRLRTDPSVCIKPKTVWLALRQEEGGKYSGYTANFCDSLSIFFTPKYPEDIREEDILGTDDPSADARLDAQALMQKLRKFHKIQRPLVLRLYIADKRPTRKSRVCSN